MLLPLGWRRERERERRFVSPDPNELLLLSNYRAIWNRGTGWWCNWTRDVRSTNRGCQLTSSSAKTHFPSFELKWFANSVENTKSFFALRLRCVPWPMALVLWFTCAVGTAVTVATILQQATHCCCRRRCRRHHHYLHLILAHTQLHGDSSSSCGYWKIVGQIIMKSHSALCPGPACCSCICISTRLSWYLIKISGWPIWFVILVALRSFRCLCCALCTAPQHRCACLGYFCGNGNANERPATERCMCHTGSTQES